ncbi:TIGR04283 family arsenosugar biosynthesis glycosyltransferase [Membranihabitans marinus]|uniref:TIGR04283 family arsenosugar biosynthesis glycosyltransferase n=1 Tax=Membranihabitans marinus TaxID=1227546 RepID=UPI001F01CFCA|nr:TIGR04283 family arsenosugar biosynthesis glycosyltransferase [Membranihabitans marinus]
METQNLSPKTSLISIIIPVYNEEEQIERQIRHLLAHGLGSEIIIVDGGSEDSSVAIAQDYPVKIYYANKGRSHQLNYGAKKATRDILYFLHADALPPQGFVENIYDTLLEGYDAGCYRLKFENDNWLMKVNSYLSRFNKGWAGGGDQSLFLFKDYFWELGGYNEDYQIMEDFDLVDRIKEKGKFKILDDDILVSSRKYKSNSYLKVQLANIKVYNMYRRGYSQEELLHTYHNMLNDIKY